VKVYRDHAFVVSDAAGPHGMQVFDLTQLRRVRRGSGTPTRFQETAHYDRVRNVHTIALDTTTGYAYLAGANGKGETCGGGLHIVDVRTPTRPTFAGCYADSARGGFGGHGYVHEAQCVVYRGPDRAFQGRELCVNFSGDAIDFVDVTDKQRPRSLGIAQYPSVGFAHQGWLSDDQRYVFVNDEFDELNRIGRDRVDSAAVRTRTLVFDVSRLEDPVLVREFFGTTAATDHNLYVRGRYMFQSNYAAGLRVIDVADPTQPREVGYFDTAPTWDNMPGFTGTWTNYPYFRSGVVAVTSISEGLFLVRYRGATAPTSSGR
jgi:choice-of-anchor B domain-containing protein